MASRRTCWRNVLRCPTLWRRRESLWFSHEQSRSFWKWKKTIFSINKLHVIQLCWNINRQSNLFSPTMWLDLIWFMWILHNFLFCPVLFNSPIPVSHDSKLPFHSLVMEVTTLNAFTPCVFGYSWNFVITFFFKSSNWFSLVQTCLQTSIHKLFVQ